MAIRLLAVSRTLATSHPLLVLAIVWLVVRLLLMRRSATRIVAWTRVAAALFVIYAVICAWYLWVPQYSDHAEPGVAAISWSVSHGGPAYHADDAPVRFAFPYGPVLYVVNGMAMSLLGPSLAASKLAGIAAGLLSIVVTGWAARRTGRAAPAAVAVTLVGYLTFGSASFWVRPEPVVLFAVAVALLGLSSASRVGAAVLIGVAAGIGVATKITALLYLAPVIAMVAWRHGAGALAMAAAVAAPVALLPFALNGRIGMWEYVDWLERATRHGMRWRSLPSMLAWAVVLAALPAAGFWRRRRGMLDDQAIGRIALAACLVGTCWLAAKRGTGPHHFLPFVPTLAYLESVAGGLLAPAACRLGVSVVIALAAIGIVDQVTWIRPVMGAADSRTVAELKAMAARHPTPVAMGYASGYRLSFLRPLLVFDGGPNPIDAVSVMDAQVSGEALAPAVVASLRACTVRTWLVPSGSEPFELTSAYLPGVALFPAEFVAAFRAHYVLVERGEHFDAWECGG
ncbi:MAG: hypothetical protein IT184_02800 [Acidobacteria bacterium]|nr:hypothetical protein [Acidobacteriota bacterium]